MIVVARPEAVRTSIDSLSYSLKDDLQATTGTLADVLRNVPSVNVDPNGEVSLRGDPGVTILVDGRPSAQFNGPGRSQMILQAAADGYARVEVMTNPSAAYSPEGSGGVINLITKPSLVRAGATVTGSARANVGDHGRYNLGANAVWTRGPLTISADLGHRSDPYVSEGRREIQRFDGASNQFLNARQSQIFDGVTHSFFVQVAADYRLDEATLLTGQVRYNDAGSNSDITETYSADNAAGGGATAYRRRSENGFTGRFSGATARLLRQFDNEGHEWSNELRYDQATNLWEDDALTDDRVPMAPALFERVNNLNRNHRVAFTSAYSRPSVDGSKLRAGYELESFYMKLDNLTARGPSQAVLTPDPRISNAFRLDQAVHALYATFERPVGERFTVQAGLRLEQANLALDQVTTNQQFENSYFRAYPTGHAAYILSSEDTLRASYGRRIQRPQLPDLNPFAAFSDSLNYRAGNPDLLPQETDAYELTWERRSQQTFYKATLYYRDTQDAIAYTTTDLGGGVFLSRPENVSARTVSGLELVANGDLGPTLRYSAGLNLAHQKMDASGVAGAVDSEGETVSGNLTLNWSPSAADLVQLSGVWTGEQLLAQGTRQPSTLINFGYRRKLTDTWSMQVTVRDVLNDYRDEVTLRTTTFNTRTDRTFGGRALLIGLTRTFGQTKPPADKFDFATGG